MGNDIFNFDPATISEIIKTGNIISDKTLFDKNAGGYASGYKFPTPQEVGGIVRFCMDNGLIYDAPKQVIQSIDGGKTQRNLYESNIGVKSANGENVAIGKLIFDESGKEVLAIQSTDDKTLEGLIYKVMYTTAMNKQAENIKDQKFVEFVRTNQNLSAVDKQKVLHLKTIEEYIDSKFNHLSNNNVILAGEFHPKRDICIYGEEMIKKLAEKKYNIKKFGSENYMEDTQLSSGAVAHSAQGIFIGNYYFKKELTEGDKKLTNLFLLDIKVPDGASEEGVKKRETNFVDVIAENSTNNNVTCFMGAGHLFIKEQLKGLGKNVISLSYLLPKNEITGLDGFVLQRYDYIKNNSFNYKTNLTDFINDDIQGKPYEKIITEADRVTDLYFSLEQSYKNLNKPKTPPVKTK